MELSIDTASGLASVALSQDGQLAAEITWRCHRNHTVELLPTIEKLLAQAGAAKEDLSAVFVCTGPGMYTGLRVGVSVAKGLAYALAIPILGVGRLELDAHAHAAFPGPIVAIHRAGRGELAWAAYAGDPWRELSAPRLSAAPELASGTRERTLFVGEIDEELATLLREFAPGGAVIAAPAASLRRAAALAELAHARLAERGPQDAGSLRPLYLRPPAIGPQQPRT
ncbi:MAG: tRNA (adenosine(37)-N6)-threonylcarbamoyltransferase complex dimerization subunit type 1 TsaB [Dehalococcoidia bacterium]|nr:tRNA (adenosine(37)-N6)-threonylcarbamoyltransferase complex dimerization subunit type 1 TsaB [Dehalococcoidia bacterium]